MCEGWLSHIGHYVEPHLQWNGWSFTLFSSSVHGSVKVIGRKPPQFKLCINDFFKVCASIFLGIGEYISEQDRQGPCPRGACVLVEEKGNREINCSDNYCEKSKANEQQSD